MVEDTGYDDNGFLAVVSLDFLAVEWIIHFSDTYSNVPRAMVETDTNTLAVVSYTSEGGLYQLINWYSTEDGEFIDGLKLQHHSCPNGYCSYEIYPEAVAAMNGSVYVVWYNTYQQCHESYEKRIWFMRAESSSNYRMFKYYSNSGEYYRRHQAYSIITQPAYNNVLIGGANCRTSYAFVTRFAYNSGTDTMSIAEGRSVGSNAYWNGSNQLDQVVTHMVISDAADWLYGVCQETTSYWARQMQFFRLALDPSSGAFDISHSDNNVRQFLNALNSDSGSTVKVIALHNFVDTDNILHAIMSNPYSSHQRIYYLKMDFTNANFSYCTIDSVITSGSTHAIFIGNTLLSHMPTGSGGAGELGYEVLFARDSTYHYTDSLTYVSGMISTNREDRRSYPASLSEYVCSTVNENTSGKESLSWQDYGTNWYSMYVGTETSYFYYTAISYRPKISQVLQGKMQTYGDETYAYVQNPIKSPGLQDWQYHIVGGIPLIIDLPSQDIIVSAAEYPLIDCDISYPQYVLNYQLESVVDQATDAVPVIPGGTWRTPFLIDNYNKRVTVWTDDTNFEGFTLKVNLLVTLPKLTVANRGLFSFYVTFLDSTCMSAMYDLPDITHTTSYIMGDPAASLAVPSGLTPAVCRTNNANLLSLGETHSELKILPPRHRAFEFHFDEETRTLHWSTNFIDQDFVEAQTFTITLSSSLNNGMPQQISLTLVIYPHACAQTALTPVEVQEGFADDTVYVSNMEVTVGSGVIQHIPVPNVSTCPDDPNCCGELIYSLVEDYSFLTNTNRTVSLQTFDNDDIGSYDVHFKVEVDGWSSTEPLVYPFRVTVNPCDVTNIQFDSVVQTVQMYRNQTETRLIDLPFASQNPSCGYDIFYRVQELPGGFIFHPDQHQLEVTVTHRACRCLKTAYIYAQVINYDGTYLDTELQVHVNIENGLPTEEIPEEMIIEPETIIEDVFEPVLFSESETEETEIGDEQSDSKNPEIEHLTNRLKMNSFGILQLDFDIEFEEIEWETWSKKYMAINSDVINRLENQTFSVRNLQETEPVLKPLVEIECLLGYYTILDNGRCDFDWTLQQNGKSGLIFNVNFENAISISANPEPEYVVIKFWGAPLLKTVDDQQIFKEPFKLKVRIPLLQNDDIIDQIAFIAGQVIVGFFLGILCLKITCKWVLRTALRDLILMVKFFQLLVFLPLVDVKFPPTAKIFFAQLFDVATLKVIPTDMYLNKYFDIPATQPYNSVFDDYTYPSTNYLQNTGTISALSVLLVVEYFIVGVALCCCSADWLAQGVYMNSTIEFLNLAYVQIVFASFLNYFTAVEGGTGGLVLSNILLILNLFVVVGLPVVTYCFLRTNYEELSQRPLRRQYDAFYEHINIWYPASFYEPVLQLLRRMFIAIVCISMTGHPLFQIASLFISSEIQLFYIGIVKPQCDPFYFKFDMINEIVVLIAIYHLICFSDFNGDPWGRAVMGYSLMVIITIQILVSSLFLGRKAFQTWMKRSRRCLFLLAHEQRQVKVKEREKLRGKSKKTNVVIDDFEDDEIYNKSKPRPVKQLTKGGKDKKQKKKKTIMDYEQGSETSRQILSGVRHLQIGLNGKKNRQLQKAREKVDAELVQLDSIEDDVTDISASPYYGKPVKLQGYKNSAKKRKKMTLEDYEKQQNELI